MVSGPAPLTIIVRQRVRIMREVDRKKSLQQLDGQDWGEPTYDSHLVTECHRLRRVPLCRFSVEDLRIMIGQSIGLHYLVPLALEHLRRKPLAQGDYYAGDLLVAVLRADPNFWHAHQDLLRDVQEIASEALTRGALSTWGAKKQILINDRHFSGMEGFPEDFGPLEEWYSLKNFAPDLHVVLVQDTHGMKGPMYQRPPYPATWARRHGRGRVFYTNMGHREDVWTNPVFKNVLFGGIHWATGNKRASVRPNMQKVAPGASQNPPPA